jgi:hypothetical protein
MGFRAWEEEDAGEGDGSGDGGVVDGDGSLLDEVAPGFEVLAGFDHHAVAEVALAALGLGCHAGDCEGDGSHVMQ